MHVTMRRRQLQCYLDNSGWQLGTMESAAPVGGDGGAGQGLRVDGVADDCGHHNE